MHVQSCIAITSSTNRVGPERPVPFVQSFSRPCTEVGGMYSCSMDACIAVDMELSPCDSVDASRYASRMRTELKTKK